MLLINVGQIKTHYSKVIGNEIIIRASYRAGSGNEVGGGAGRPCQLFCHLLSGPEGGTWGLCGEDTLR